MNVGTGDDRRLPVPVSADGPLALLSDHVHNLYIACRYREALAAADAYEPIARAGGDHRTVGFLLQGRMYCHLSMGQHREALATGEDLLRLHQANGSVLGEAKILSDLAELYVLEGQLAEGMRYLARAGRLLDGCPHRGERYVSALSSLNDAANAAELYETAASTHERVAASWAANGPPDTSNSYNIRYAWMLSIWGLRLAHLGREQEAAARLRKAAAICEEWLAALADGDLPPDILVSVQAILALALAKQGKVDRARPLAERAVVPARQLEVYGSARMAHLALGICLRAAGDLTGAEREFLAAEQLCEFGGRMDERLIARHELALLAARRLGDTSSRHLVDTVVTQARYLWELRLQRLAMLRQAQQREELEWQRAQAELEMLRDPLTGLGNRRQFDRLLAGLDTAPPAEPLILLLIDIDRFKAINDTHSHSAGDEVLRVLGSIIRAQCRRAGDIPVRYAGDEFTVFLHATTLDEGLTIAERIRSAVYEADLTGVCPGLPVSISVGVATLTPGMTGQDLFRAADLHLYQAKRGGRDRIAA